jgi:hypothetical protein
MIGHLREGWNSTAITCLGECYSLRNTLFLSLSYCRHAASAVLAPGDLPSGALDAGKTSDMEKKW